jgi:hypothetical protein
MLPTPEVQQLQLLTDGVVVLQPVGEQLALVRPFGPDQQLLQSIPGA